MKTNLEVSVELKEAAAEQGWPEISAYVFSLSGRLLARKPVKQEPKKPAVGHAELTVAAQPVIVKIGPALEEPAGLTRCAPVVQKADLSGKEKASLQFSILKPGWWCWLRIPYLVTGTVAKQEHEAPICFGQVDVYEVNIAFCIPRIPDLIIEKIRDALLDIILDPPCIRPDIVHKWPDPDDDFCGTPPGPRPLLTTDILEKLAALPDEWSFARQRYESLGTVQSRLAETLGVMQPLEKIAWLGREAVEGVTISRILDTSTSQFRELLLGRFQSFRFWLCWYPWIHWLWWPYCRRYSLQKLGTASLQPDGSFTLSIKISICRETPDLWFSVRQKISGTERVIYARYPVPCNTYWNHPSGKPVHLTVTDPLAIPCPTHPDTDVDPADSWVVPLAIGNYSLKKIYGTGAGTLPADSARIGLYKSIVTGLGGSLATFCNGPFGGVLGLRFLFSPALEAAGIKYYRFKYRVDSAGEWKALTQTVVRHYSHYDAVSKSLYFLPYPLGPRTLGTENALFEIPPADPPNKAVEPFAQWYVIDAAVDLMNGYFDSVSSLPAGSGDVEFKLELFDAAGIRVNPAALGILFRLPATEDVWEVITTADPATVNPALVAPDPEDPAFQTFIFRLQIDNRQPTALIDGPTISPSGNVTGPCGMTTFAATDKSATLPFQARHPRRFGIYSFTIYRGTVYLPALAMSGQVGDIGASGSFSVSAFLKPDPMHLNPDLLDGCPAAAFSENLYIWNMAFNGWTRVGPDASAVRAFALVPE